MIDLLLATTNSGKIQEIKKVISGLPIRIHSLAEFHNVPEVVESGATFEENALIKARAYSKFSGLLTLADDSGLVVPALHGAPGIYSARYAGPHATDSENRQKLLLEMKNIPLGKREAAFVCVLALTDGSFEKTVEGRCGGEISFSEKGSSGFGYDSVFYVPSLGKTMAEMSLEEKNRISHRGQAFLKIKEFL